MKISNSFDRPKFTFSPGSDKGLNSANTVVQGDGLHETDHQEEWFRFFRASTDKAILLGLSGIASGRMQTFVLEKVGQEFSESNCAILQGW